MIECLLFKKCRVWGGWTSNDFNGITKCIKIMMYSIKTLKKSIKFMVYSIKTLTKSIKVMVYWIKTF